METIRRALVILIILSAALPVTLGQSAPAHDVRITWPAPAPAGEYAVTWFTITNFEADVRTFQFEVTDTTGGLTGHVLPAPFVDVAPGASRDLNVTISVPDGTPPGTHIFRLDVGSPFLSDGAISSHDWDVTVTQPNVGIRESLTSISAAAGTTVVIPLAAYNHRDHPASLEVTPRVASPHLKVELEPRSPAYLAAWENRTINMSVSLSDDATGDHTFTLEVAFQGSSTPFKSFDYHVQVMQRAPTPPPAMPPPNISPRDLHVRAPSSSDVMFWFISNEPTESGRTILVSVTDVTTGALLVSDGRFLLPPGRSEFAVPVPLQDDGREEYRVDVSMRLQDDGWSTRHILTATVVGAPSVNASSPMSGGPSSPRLPEMGESLVRITSPKDVQLVPQGGSHGVALTVTNVGNETTQVRLRHRTEATGDGEEMIVELTWSTATFTLAPGESRQVIMTMDTRADAPLGAALSLFSVTPFTSSGEATSFIVDVPTRIVAPSGPGAFSALGASITAHPGASAAILVGGLGAIAAPLAFRREWWRYLAVAPFAALYTRLVKGDVLDHKTRDDIMFRIRAEPGVHFSALKKDTGLPTGVLVHHLRTLERHHLVRSRREGMYRCFYPVDVGIPNATTERLTPMQARIIETLAAGPLTQRELADRLGLTLQGANYHVKTLERKGRIVMERDDGQLQCRVADPEADLTAARSC